MSKILKEEVRRRLLQLKNYDELLYNEKIDRAGLEKILKDILDNIVSSQSLSTSEQDRKKIIGEMVNELVGFGLVDSLMNDPEVTEIMINGPQKIYVEKRGKNTLCDIKFEDEQQLRYWIYKLLTPKRRRVDESHPFEDVSLADGSRVNIIIPPLSLDGSVVTITKFMGRIKTIEDLINLGALDRRMADFLVACIKAKMNILFSGSTGAGKTTTLSVLSSYIDNNERIVTIEDTAELHLNQEHVVRLETRPSNIEGKGAVTIRDIFKNSLRMRPSRIILGEIRGSEALDVLQAMCSGHAGSLAVLHASSPKEVIYRLETMALLSGLPLNLEIIHRQIAAAVNLIIQHEHLSDGSRKITHITQVSGLGDGGVMTEDIFNYELGGVGEDGNAYGKFKATGIIPIFYPIFTQRGVSLSKEIFKKD